MGAGKEENTTSPLKGVPEPQGLKEGFVDLHKDLHILCKSFQADGTTSGSRILLHSFLPPSLACPPSRLPAGAQPGKQPGWGFPWGLPLPSPPSRSLYGGDSRLQEHARATLPDGWQPLSVTELSQLKPLKVILLLILCGCSHSFLRETSDFHLRDAWLRLSYSKR